MALRVDYVVRETGTNLKRNLTLSFATVVTIAMALTSVGAALLMRQGVANADVRFHGDIQTIVFLNATASQDQVDAVKRALDENPHVKSERYLDHEAANQEFKDLFYKEPDIANSLTPAETPTSYKVQLKDASFSVVQSVNDQFSKMPGVQKVIAPTDAVKKQEDSFRKFSNFALLIALVVGFASLVLIVNSIRIAMFARRREIEVMKLVGATNWFIRIPFMTEGLVQGLVGAVVGIFIVRLLDWKLLPTLVDGGGIWTDFHLTSADLFTTSVWLVILGGIVGVIASAFAATRFLDV